MTDQIDPREVANGLRDMERIYRANAYGDFEMQADLMALAAKVIEAQAMALSEAKP